MILLSDFPEIPTFFYSWCWTRLDVFRRAPRRILNFSVSKVSFLYETKVYYLYYIVVHIGAYFKTLEDHI